MLPDISTVKNTVTNVARLAKFKVNKYSPEILLGAGLVAGVGTVVLACRATLKAEEITADAHEKLEKIESVKTGKVGIKEGETYSYEDYRKDKFIVRAQTCTALAKEYAPAVTAGVLSVVCVLSAYGILKKRNAVVLGLYKASEKAFQTYRQRVRDEFGPEKERDIYLGLREEKVEERVEQENGSIKKVKTKVKISDPNMPSPYARFFDECNPNWSKNPASNKQFLELAQNQLNQMLRARQIGRPGDPNYKPGVVFLNEAYHMLGFDAPSYRMDGSGLSEIGQMVGWTSDPEAGDGFIDFFMYEDVYQKREFVNGYERSILLDFNVDGYIADLI